MGAVAHAPRPSLCFGPHCRKCGNNHLGGGLGWWLLSQLLPLRHGLRVFLETDSHCLQLLRPLYGIFSDTWGHVARDRFHFRSTASSAREVPVALLSSPLLRPALDRLGTAVDVHPLCKNVVDALAVCHSACPGAVTGGMWRACQRWTSLPSFKMGKTCAELCKEVAAPPPCQCRSRVNASHFHLADAQVRLFSDLADKLQGTTEAAPCSQV